VLARIALDQLGEIIHRERRQFVHLVFEPDPLAEWVWRIWLEPRRLFWRYLTTNPRALYLLLHRSRPADISGTHNR